jgi:hypothetical protein
MLGLPLEQVIVELEQLLNDTRDFLELLKAVICRENSETFQNQALSEKETLRLIKLSDIRF